MTIIQEDNASEFLEFASTCEKIRSTRSKLKKVGLLAEYFASKSDEDLDISSTFLSGRIFPPGQNEVNVGSSLIWKTIAGAFDLGDAELSRFYMKHGDLGSAVEELLTTRVHLIENQGSSLFERRPLTLKGVHSAFEELARTAGKGSTERKQQILGRLVSSIRMPVEAKYLVRILTGEMRIGLVEGLVEESLGKCFQKTVQEIRSANLVSGRIGQVATLAKHDRLSEAKLTPGRPTNFMLADSAENAELLFAKFEKMPVLSEYKYDGIRAQCHLKEGVISIFSRNLEDVTKYFPEIVQEMRKFRGHDLIIDGEIVASRDGTPLSFQLLQRRLRKLERSLEDVPVKYFMFDLLYCDAPLINSELSERVRLLRSLVRAEDGLSFSEQRSVSSPEEILSMFDESKRLGFEGLVVKDPESKYSPGRRGSSWVKLKKELDTLDVVIVAAEFGHGKRAGVISDYTFAVRDGDDLKVVGKAYSGLTDQEIAQMTSALKQITLQDYGYRRTVKPQIVLEVAFDAIQKSDRHNGGYALRFPRIKRIRDDKSPRDIDSISKVREIYEAQKVKL